MFPNSPAMPERKLKIKARRPTKIKIAVRPPAITLEDASEFIYQPRPVEQIVRYNDEIRERRQRVAVRPPRQPKPAPQPEPSNKQVVMVVKEFTPPLTDVQMQVKDILARMDSEGLTAAETNALIREAIFAPSRARITEVIETYTRKRDELEANYYAPAS